MNQLGYANNNEMLAALSSCKEEWTDGQHPVLQQVLNRKETPVKIPQDILAQMDDNIRADMIKINRHRSPPVSLKYFQYLAALSVENFLRRLSEGPKQLLTELQTFDGWRRRHLPRPQSTDDLRKLALWIATGGGKTLLMHLNYHQFLRWKKDLFKSLDNIILLTPHETLSAQHLEEMRLSGVPCFRHGESHSRLDLTGGHPIRVIEITKLSPRTHSNKSPLLDEFADSRNLVFVDEGHKGAGGKAWFEHKRKLAEKGFLMEYSATFGQAVADPKDKERAEEYAHAIALDYSYRYFHGDGYGKDFDVVNLKGSPAAEKQDILMLGNLLSFLQQRMCFAENREEFLRHNLEPPLLLMLGATVTGSKNAETTDIAEFTAFLHRVALDKNQTGRAWLQQAIGRILRGDSDIEDESGVDIFSKRLDWLNRRFSGESDTPNAGEVCNALRKHVLRADAPGALQFCAIPGAKGEAVLRVSNGDPFGLIYVGDVIPKLRDIIQGVEPGIASIEESTLGRFFPEVAGAASPINILIGAKKFMEGWSSWRVSGMGLLHVGRSEGPLVFQLFGRGVRLKGAGMTLKRGGSHEAPPPPNLALLETMNIFGVQANFVSMIREMLDREGVWKETLFLPVSEPSLPKSPTDRLIVPEYPEQGFTESIELGIRDGITAHLDLSSSAIRVATGKEATQQTESGVNSSGGEASFPDTAIAVVDFDQLRRQLLEYRTRSKKWNLTVPLENLPDILRNQCGVKCDADAPLEPNSRRDIRRIRDAAFSVLRKYTDKFYTAQRSEWELQNVRYGKLSKKHPNFEQLEIGLELRIPPTEKQFIQAIRDLISNRRNLEQMWNSQEGDPPRIYFCHHLYQPLLLMDALKTKNKGIDVSPPGLNSGEAAFVRQLKKYLESAPNRPKNEQIFLLRNQSRAGVGFHGDAGAVYPDFILWIKRGQQQRIVFIEPHGMRHAPAYAHDPKARLHETLGPIQTKLATKHKNVTMDSFVISETPYDDLVKNYDSGDWKEEDFHERHILFAGEVGNIPRILGDM